VFVTSSAKIGLQVDRVFIVNSEKGERSSDNDEVEEEDFKLLWERGDNSMMGSSSPSLSSPTSTVFEKLMADIEQFIEDE
jgi:hypothetical protein